mgnify:CR=1 FL=1
MQTLKEYRESKGIKLSTVAEHLGVTRQTYSSYEKHQERMSIDQAKAVCKFLGCSVGDIFLPKDVN